MSPRRTLAVTALAVGALSLSPAPALAQEPAPPVVGGEAVGREVVVEHAADRYVCVGTARYGTYCVVVWYPGA